MAEETTTVTTTERSGSSVPKKWRQYFMRLNAGHPEAFIEAVRRFPHDRINSLKLARRLGGDDDTWIKASQEDEDRFLLVFAGIALRDGEHYTEAIAAWRLASEMGADVAIMLAETLLYVGETDDVENLLVPVITEHEEDWEFAAYLLGRHYAEELGRSDAEVVELLRSGIDADDEAPIWLAHALIGSGYFDEARRILAGEMDRNPNASIVLGNLLSENLHDFAAAELAYRVGIARGDSHSAFNLGLMLLEVEGRDEEARQMITLASTRGDTRAASWLGENR